MKISNRVISLFLIAVLCLVLVSCSATDSAETETSAVKESFELRGDWKHYESLRELKDDADLIVIGDVSAIGTPYSWEYTEEDFNNADTDDDTYNISLMVMSIHTPYTVNVSDVLFNRNGYEIGETMQIDENCGVFAGYEFKSENAIEMELDGKYIFALRAIELNGDYVYVTVSPYQGIAQITENADGTISITEYEYSNLYDDMTDIDEIKAALPG